MIFYPQAQIDESEASQFYRIRMGQRIGVYLSVIFGINPVHPWRCSSHIQQFAMLHSVCIRDEYTAYQFLLALSSC